MWLVTRAEFLTGRKRPFCNPYRTVLSAARFVVQVIVALFEVIDDEATAEIVSAEA